MTHQPLDTPADIRICRDARGLADRPDLADERVSICRAAPWTLIGYLDKQPLNGCGTGCLRTPGKPRSAYRVTHGKIIYCRLRARRLPYQISMYGPVQYAGISR